MRPLRSVRARVAPDHGFVIVLGTGFREPFQPDFRERRLCYAGDDMLYLMSAVGFAHDDDVTIEAWPGPPPPDPAAEQSETASMLLTEGRLYVSRALEAAASPVLAAGPGGRYELRVEVTGRAALAEYYARYTPGEPKAVGRKRDRDGGNRAAFDHQQQCPPVQKAGHRMPSVAQIHVLPAGLWEDRSQFRVREGARERNRTACDPRRKHDHAARQPLRNDVRVDEDARPDDAADDDHRGIERPERAAEGHPRKCITRAVAHRSLGRPGSSITHSFVTASYRATDLPSCRFRSTIE